MSNWVYYEIEFRKEDEEKVKKATSRYNERQYDNRIVSGKLVTYFFAQSASGGFDENNKLCRAGVAFRGCHGEGFEFDRQVFASDGKNLAELPCNRDGVAMVFFKDGVVDKDSLEEAWEYAKVLKNANEILEA